MLQHSTDFTFFFYDVKKYTSGEDLEVRSVEIFDKRPTVAVMGLLDAFEKFVNRLSASSCPSVHIKQFGSHRTDFD